MSKKGHDTSQLSDYSCDSDSHADELLNIKLNYFQLLGLPEDYAVSLSQLEASYILMQRKMHPDRFTGNSREQRIAVQYTAFINEAYETLLSPLKRAQYLLTLSGVEMDIDTKTINDSDFLIEQMELREALSDIRHVENQAAAIDSLRRTVENKLTDLSETFSFCWQNKTDENIQQAIAVVQKMYFFHKFIDEAVAEEERMLLL